MSIVKDVKLIVSGKGVEVGMRKDANNCWGTVIPNYFGNNARHLVTEFFANEVNFIVRTDGIIDGEQNLTLTAETGDVYDLMWDDIDLYYKASGTNIRDVMNDHYDGVLEFVLSVTPPPPPPLRKADEE